MNLKIREVIKSSLLPEFDVFPEPDAFALLPVLEPKGSNNSTFHLVFKYKIVISVVKMYTYIEARN